MNRGKNGSNYKIATFFTALILLSSTVLSSIPTNNNLPQQAFAQTTRTLDDEIRDIGEYVVFGLEKVSFKKNITINSGHVGANGDGKITVTKNTRFLDGNSTLVGDTIIIGNTASAQNVFFNDLKTKKGGEILGTQNTPVIFPVVDPLPDFPSRDTRATADRIIAKDSTRVLGPSISIDKIIVNSGATAIFTGGQYSATSIVAKNGAKLIFQGPSEVSVQKKLSLQKDVILGPSETSSISASDITIFVGSNDPSVKGKPTAKFGTNNVVDATVYVPNGTITIGANVDATGAFIANSVKVGANTVLTYDSSFRTTESFADEYTRLANKLNSLGSMSDESILADYLNHTITNLRTDTENLVVDSGARQILLSILDSALQSAGDAGTQVLLLDEEEADGEINQTSSFIQNYINEIETLRNNPIPSSEVDILTSNANQILQDSLKRDLDALSLTEGIPLVISGQVIEIIESSIARMAEIVLRLESLGIIIDISVQRFSPAQGVVSFFDPTTQQIDVIIPNPALATFNMLMFSGDEFLFNNTVATIKDKVELLNISSEFVDEIANLSNEVAADAAITAGICIGSTVASAIRGASAAASAACRSAPLIINIPNAVSLLGTHPATLEVIKTTINRSLVTPTLRLIETLGTCASPPQDLVGWWPGENNAKDLTGNHNGTIVDDTTFVAGYVDQAFSFDGENDHVNLANLGINNVDVPFSIAAWINPNENLGALTPSVIIGDGQGIGGNKGRFFVHMSLDTEGVVSVGVGSTQTFSIGKFTTDPALSAGDWTFVVATYDGSGTAQGIKLYINGKEDPGITRGADIVVVAPRDDWFIADGSRFGSPTFDGLIDEVQIFNRDITEDEIRNEYKALFGGKCKDELSINSASVQMQKTISSESLFDPIQIANATKP